MKILMFCETFNLNFNYQENSLTKSYLKMEHTVAVIVPKDEDDGDDFWQLSIEDGEYKGLVIYKLNHCVNIFNKIIVLKSVKVILNLFNPEVIFCHNLNFNLAAITKFCDINSCMLKIDFHIDYVNSGKSFLSKYIQHRFIRSLYFRFYSRCFDKIYAITPGTIKFLVDNYSLNNSQIELLPLGCDLDESIDDNFVNEKIDEFLFHDSSLKIFTAGIFDENKKLHTLIEAVKRLESSKIRLIVLGTFNNEAYKLSIENLTGDASNIFFLGWKNYREIVKYIKYSDLAVFPGTQSVIWQQCLGMGLPIIVSSKVNVGSRIIDQMVEYLNINDNMDILYDYENYVGEIEYYLNLYLSNKSALNKKKFNCLKLRETFLNYDHIANRTIN